VAEKWVYPESGQEIPEPVLKKEIRKEIPALLIKVSYKTHFVYLWEVTWEYVVHNYEIYRDRKEER